MLTIADAKREIKQIRQRYGKPIEIYISGQGDEIIRQEVPENLSPGTYELRCVLKDRTEDGPEAEETVLKDKLIVEAADVTVETPPPPHNGVPARSADPFAVLLEFIGEMRGEVRELRERDDQRKDDHYKTSLKMMTDFLDTQNKQQQANWQFLQSAQEQLHATIRQEVRTVNGPVEKPARNIEEAVSRLVTQHGPSALEAIVAIVAQKTGQGVI